MSRIRVQQCDGEDSRKRLVAAEKFLEVAELVDGEPDPDFANVAASLAVLAGIAASDSACCKAHGYRSRAERHMEAVRVLERVANGGKEAGEALRRLLDLKDSAQYGLFNLGRGQTKLVLRQAQRLLAFAKAVDARP